MTDWKRAALRRLIVPLALVVAGLVVVLASSDRTVEIVGWGVVCAGITVAIALAFLEVGYSEDRERSRSKHGR